MYEVRRFAELDSTNRYLLDQARAGAPAGLVAVADHQTAGRGRLGRRWEAPAGTNLLASVLLRPVLALDQLHLCTVALALAARAACLEAVGLEPDLKWPNDLLLGEKKLAGILAETLLPGSGPGPATEPVAGPDPGSHAGPAVVVGIGLNLAWPAPSGEGDADGRPVPDELAGATSLWRESGEKIGSGAFLEILLAQLEPLVEALGESAGRLQLAADYRRACASLGRRVTVALENGTVSGTVADITVEGHLLLDVGVCIKTITAGDVVHLRSSR